MFSVHSWIVFKRAGAKNWTRYDVVGWGMPVRTNGWPADGRWYGNMPVAIADVSGPDAEKMIPKIEAAVRDYSYAQAGDYKIWPGPNSNSFTATVLRAVPELGVELPPNAIGRDFRPGFYAGLTDSGTGIEVNLLGLVAGLDLRHPALKLPGFGRIGVDAPIGSALAK